MDEILRHTHFNPYSSIMNILRHLTTFIASLLLVMPARADTTNDTEFVRRLVPESLRIARRLTRG